MSKRTSLAFLQGLFQSQKERHDPTSAMGVDLPTGSSAAEHSILPLDMDDPFGSIVNELGSCGDGGSLFDEIDLSSLFPSFNGSADALVSFEGTADGYGNSNPLLDHDIRTYDSPNRNTDQPSNSGHSHDRESNPSTSYSSDDCGENGAKRSLLVEIPSTPKLINENVSCANSCGVDLLVDCQLNSVCASPFHDTFHDSDLSGHNVGMIGEGTATVMERVAMASEFLQDQPVEEFQFGAMELERFLLEENNKLDLITVKQMLSQANLLPPI